MSYLEIYNEEIRDLLAKDPNKKLELKESVDRGVYVKDLMQFVVKGPAEMNSVLQVRQGGRPHTAQCRLCCSNPLSPFSRSPSVCRFAHGQV